VTKSTASDPVSYGCALGFISASELSASRSGLAVSFANTQQ